MQNVSVYPIEGTPRVGRRSLDERVFVRAPWVYCALAWALTRLSPGSRLRRVFLSHSAARGFAAFNRGDLALVMTRWTTDVRYESPSQLRTVGFGQTVQGREAVAARAADAFRDLSVWKVTPSVLVDLDGRLVVLGRVRVRTRQTALTFEGKWASVFDMRRGLMRVQRDFLSWGEALAAVGLDLERIPHLDLPRPARGS